VARQAGAHFGSGGLDYAEVVSQEYQESWQEYRKLRNRFFIILLSFPPGAMFIAYVFSWAFHTLIPGFVAAFVWIAAFLVTGIRLQLWPCPRCGEWFSATSSYNKSFLARKCVHCGLPKFAVEDDVPAEK
jgi:hypothetical protein